MPTLVIPRYIKAIRKYITYIVFAIVSILAVLYILSKDEGVVEQPRISANVGHLNIPDTLIAGSHYCFTSKGSCDIIIKQSWGVTVLHQSANDEICLADSLISTSGLYEVVRICDGQVVNSKVFTVIPRAPFGPLETYVGSKSITADGGKHWAMITAIPVDSLDNPTSDRTEVVINLSRPSGQVVKLNQVTENFITFYKIYSGYKTGKTIIGARASTSISQEKEILEEPGYPSDFTISSHNVFPFADSRQYFQVKTTLIKDIYGNIVKDGTLIDYVVFDEDGTMRQLHAYTISGVAILNVQNPMLQGEVRIQASVYGDVLSNSISVYFSANIEEIPIYYSVEDDEIIVGPLVGRLGQYLNDGKLLEFNNETTDELSELVIMDGHTSYDCQFLDKGDYSTIVSVGGLKREFKFSKL